MIFPRLLIFVTESVCVTTESRNAFFHLKIAAPSLQGKPPAQQTVKRVGELRWQAIGHQRARIH
jgi:hypothetical protein